METEDWENLPEIIKKNYFVNMRISSFVLLYSSPIDIPSCIFLYWSVLEKRLNGFANPCTGTEFIWKAYLCSETGTTDFSLLICPIVFPHRPRNISRSPATILSGTMTIYPSLLSLGIWNCERYLLIYDHNIALVSALELHSTCGCFCGVALIKSIHSLPFLRTKSIFSEAVSSFARSSA